MKAFKKRNIIIGTAFCILLSINVFLLLSSNVPVQNPHEGNLLQSASPDGIIITNANISSVSSAGDGSIGTPYVISGLEIDTTDGTGVKFDGITSYFILENSTIKASTYSAYIDFCSADHATVQNNTLTASLGIGGINSDGITVFNNTIHMNYTTSFSNCDNLNFTANVVYIESETGDMLNIYQHNITFKDNIVHGKSSNIRLDDCPSANITGNVLYNASFGMDDTSSVNAQGYNFSNNQINGKPVGFFLNMQSTSIQGNTYGQVILVNCSDMDIDQYEISDVAKAIQVIEGKGVTINDVTIYAKKAICIENSIDVEVKNSKLNCMQYGINCENLTGSFIDNNYIQNAPNGIYIDESADIILSNNVIHHSDSESIYIYADNTTILKNVIVTNITENYDGATIAIDGGTGNIIYHNILIGLGNTSAILAYDFGTGTIWYNATLQEGNYWSNWNGSGSYTILLSGEEDLYPLAGDIDGDGLSEMVEIFDHGTNPFLEDSDGDSYSDSDEIAVGSDPLDPTSFPSMFDLSWAWWLIIIIGAGVAFLFVAIKMEWITIKKKRDAVSKKIK